MAVTISFFDQFVEFMGDSTIDMDADLFKIELYSAYTFTAADSDRAGLTAATALATGNGYVNPGQNLVSVTWTQTTGTTTFDAADNTWTASGGSIGPATDAIIYSDTSVTDKLVCDIDFGASETAGDGTDFKVTFNASGIFTIS